MPEDISVGIPGVTFSCRPLQSCFPHSCRAVPNAYASRADRRRVLHDLRQRGAQLHCRAHRPLPTGAERERVARSGNRQCVLYESVIN